MNAPHISSIGRITRLLVTRLGGQALILCQTPVVMVAADSEPEPDFSVVRLDPRD